MYIYIYEYVSEWASERVSVRACVRVHVRVRGVCVACTCACACAWRVRVRGVYVCVCVYVACACACARVCIQGIWNHPCTLFISETEHFRKKHFRQKLWGSKWSIQWSNQSDLWWCHQDQSNVTLNFLNGTPYFLLHIPIAHPESFPKHYNKIFFH